jgi:hypothetical protein
MGLMDGMTCRTFIEMTCRGEREERREERGERREEEELVVSC